MTKYNLSKIMKRAWEIFNIDCMQNWFEFDECVWEEMAFDLVTFSDCLKQAWVEAKRYAKYQEDHKEEIAKEAAMLVKSEEVKAWDWACKKLGVTVDVTPSYKYSNVKTEAKFAYPNTSVWSLAMKAVKRHLV